MYTYFKYVHNLPPELVRMIFGYATLVYELRNINLRTNHRFFKPLVNRAFFHQWDFIRSRVNGRGQLIVYGYNGGPRLIYQLIN